MRPIILLAVLGLCSPAFAAPVPKELIAEGKRERIVVLGNKGEIELDVFAKAIPVKELEAQERNAAELLALVRRLKQGK